MTALTPFRALVKRLESAKTGSLALELEIAAAIGWGRRPVPPWTVSIDSALTLIPLGYEVLRIVRARDFWECSMDGSRYVLGTGATMPLAICAAALTVHSYIAADGAPDSPVPA